MLIVFCSTDKFHHKSIENNLVMIHKGSVNLFLFVLSSVGSEMISFIDSRVRYYQKFDQFHRNILNAS